MRKLFTAAKAKIFVEPQEKSAILLQHRLKKVPYAEVAQW